MIVSGLVLETSVSKSVPVSVSVTTIVIASVSLGVSDCVSVTFSVSVSASASASASTVLSWPPKPSKKIAQGGVTRLYISIYYLLGRRVVYLLR